MKNTSPVSREPEFDFEALKDVLLCPKSQVPLVMDGPRLVSTDPAGRASYEILSGIPRLVVEDATELTPEAWRDVMQRHGRDPETGQPVIAGAP